MGWACPPQPQFLYFGSLVGSRLWALSWVPKCAGSTDYSHELGPPQFQLAIFTESWASRTQWSVEYWHAGASTEDAWTPVLS